MESLLRLNTTRFFFLKFNFLSSLSLLKQNKKKSNKLYKQYMQQSKSIILNY